jgi:CheY-like chemotaxis protein
MTKNSEAVDILIVEDDDDDYFLIKEAMGEAHVINPVQRVKDGEELMVFLKSNEKDKNSHFHPGLILLDLNLPRKSGREALAEIKSNDLFRKIPVIVLTTSNAKEDISHTYQLGVNSFIQKPLRFERMVEFFAVMSKYWFHFVELPSAD